MKKLISIIPGLLVLVVGLDAQTTSYDTDFSSGHPFVSVYDWTATHEIKATVAGGEMIVDYDKSADTLWNRLVFWVKPFDIGVAPHCKFRIRGDKAFEMNLAFKDETAATVSKSFNVTTEYQEVVLDLSEDISSLGSTLLDELQWDVGFSNDSGTFFLDDFKMGVAAAPPGDTTGGDTLTGFLEDFNEGTIPSNWKEAASYNLSNLNNALVIDVDKGTNESGNKFFVELGKLYDFSEATHMSFDIKVSESTLVYFLFYDNLGQVIRVDHRVIGSEELNPIYINFGGSDRIDYTAFSKMAINVAQTAFSYQGRVTIDNLRLGTLVTPFSSILAQQDQFFQKNSKGSRIFITDIENAASVEISGAESLIENAGIASVESGTAEVRFDCIDGVSGEDTITIHTRGIEGFQDGSVKVKLVVEENNPPSLTPLQDLFVDLTDTTLVLAFDGIKDNNVASDQQFQVDVESMDGSVLSIASVEYESPMPGGFIHMDLLKAGAAELVITLTEDEVENGEFRDTILVTVVEGLNHAPTIDHPGIVKKFIGNASDTLFFTGVTDGDQGLQVLSLSVSSSDSLLVMPVSASELPGDSAMAIIEAKGPGSVTLELSIADDGGTPGNNGDKSISVSFTLNIVEPPVTGYLADFSNVEADVNRGLWTFGNSYELSTVDSSANGFHAMKVDATDKFYWDGYNLSFRAEGIELDLSDYPYFSMEIYPLDDNTLHWIWFYDYTDTLRNTQNNRSEEKLMWAESGKWNHLFYDFSGELDWRSEEHGIDVDKSRIIRILFDMHNDDFVWPPPPNYTGSFLIRNLRVGSEAQTEPQPVKPRLDEPVIPLFFENSGQHHVDLTGIDDGTGSTGSLILQVESSDETVIGIVSTDPILEDGSSGFTLNALKVGLSRITITLSGGNSEADLVSSQWVRIISGEYSDAASVLIDVSNTYQTMRGFGTYMDSRYGDLYLDEMNATAVRAGLISNQIEWENDNNDPYVLNMEAFDYGAFDWDYLRKLKEGGVESFILTSWSPPAWMKDNLTESHYSAGQSSYTDQVKNRLSYHYYEEFAESMVAVVRMFREKAGIDLTGIGLQNEPAFHEPYPSAILDPIHFNELIRVVGKRFEEEGIETLLYMPEQVFSQEANSINDYIDVLQTDQEADRLCTVIASHSYAQNGIDVATPDFTEWTAMFNNANDGANPKELWMTETHRTYSDHKDAIYIAAGIQGSLIAGNVSLWTQWSFKDQFTTNGQPNSMLYAMRNFARYVRPGAFRLGSTSSEKALLVSAFRHPETLAVSIVIVNTGSNNVTADISAANLPYLYDTYRTTKNEKCKYVGETDLSKLLAVPGHSVITLHAIEESMLTMDQVADLSIEENSGKQSLEVTGISNGAGGIAGLTITVETDKPGLISELLAGEITGAGSCQISFMPGADLTGTGKITINLTDGEFTRMETFYVTVTEEQSTGIDDPEWGNGITIFPNPVNKLLQIHSHEEICAIEVVNVTGRVMISVRTDQSRIAVLETGDLDAGIYYLRIRNQKEEVLYKSFVKL